MAGKRGTFRSSPCPFSLTGRGEVIQHQVSEGYGRLGFRLLKEPPAPVFHIWYCKGQAENIAPRKQSEEERPMQKMVTEIVGGEPYDYYPPGEYIVFAKGVCDGRPTFKYSRALRLPGP